MEQAPRPQSGFTFVELMFSIALIVTASVVLMSHLAVNYSSTRVQREKVFAYMTAKSILAEIHALAESDDGSGTFDVESLDNGTTTLPTLTLSMSGGQLVAPDHELSGNFQREGQWVWSRRINVSQLPGIDNRKLRYATVRIFKRRRGGVETEVASLSSVVNSVASGFPTSQVFDLYLIAVESSPGWWVYMESIRPFMEATISDLESRNPGLELRTHWITKASYGRDPIYRPYINEVVESTDPSPYVYWYPGRMPLGSASTYYYVPGAIRARFVTEAGEINGHDAVLNPYPYAVADRFNHSMRYPRERAFHEARVAEVRARRLAIETAQAASLPEPPELTDMSEEPTLRLLLEDMQTDPDRYRHALMVNLHGELLPVPALRNYSDAAKDPVGLPGVRVVTHPEELRTERPPSASAADVVLRVYSWLEQPELYKSTLKMPDDRPIALQIMDLDLTDGAGGLYPDVSIEALPGGVVVNGDDRYHPFSKAKSWSDGPYPDEMFYRATFVDPGPNEQKFTLILLYNTPVQAPAIADGPSIEGLFANERSRLYGLEYLPAPVAGKDFARDLSTAGDGPKNTARWRITVPRRVFGDARWVDLDSPPNYVDPTATGEPDRVLAVRTRIWDTSATDQFGNPATPFETGTVPAGIETRIVQPSNFSETYTWWASSIDAVPATERAQFDGDPRLNPYKDLLNGDPDFPDGYNWFFDSLEDGSDDARPDYPGLDGNRLFDRWSSRVRLDLPRFWQLWREGLVASNVVFSTLNGWSFYYVSQGGEVGYDTSNGYPNSIPLDLTAFGVPGTSGFLSNFRGSLEYPRAPGSDYWWARPWSGELCPDDAYASQWLGVDALGGVRGNLSAGTAAGEFYREVDTDAYSNSLRTAHGTEFLTARHQTARFSATSFMDVGTSSSTFFHEATTRDSDLTGAGADIGSTYGVEVPTPVPVNRPFALADAVSVAEEFDLAPYTTRRHRINLVERYFDYPVADREGSALLSLVSPGGRDAAHFAVNGLSPTTTINSTVLVKYALLAVLHSFFELGDPSRTFAKPLAPRVQITFPTEISEVVDPGSIDIQFETAWTRWDGRPYTQSMPTGVSADELQLDYKVMYSRDAGKTWRLVQDDSITHPGEGLGTGLAHADMGTGGEILTWATPRASFPEGNYLLRIEVYRRDQQLHYAHHTKRFFLQR